MLKEQQRQHFIFCIRTSGLELSKEPVTLATREKLPQTAVIFLPAVPNAHGINSSKVEQLTSTRIPFVPLEAKKAGKALQTIRVQHQEFRGPTPSEIAGTIHIPSIQITSNDIVAFENGASPILGANLPQVYKGVSKFFDESHPLIIELETQKDEQLWLRTLSKEDMTLGKSLRLLRASQHLSLTMLAEKTGLTKSDISRYERDVETPLEFNLRRTMAGLGIPPENKVAQLLFLQRAKKKLMSVEELQTCSFGNLVKYIRILMGLSEKDLGDKLNLSQPSISIIESDKMSKRVLNKFTNMLTESSPTLVDIIRQKAKNPEIQIPDSTMQKILSEQYLFMESIEILGKKTMTNHDVGIFNRITTKKTIGEMLVSLLKEKKISKAEICRRTGLAAYTVSAIAKRTSDEVTIVKIANALGYDIHHAITLFLIDQAIEERVRKKQYKGQIA